MNDKITRLESYVARQQFDLLSAAQEPLVLSQDESKLLEDPTELAELIFDAKPDDSGRVHVRGGPVHALVRYLTYFKTPSTLAGRWARRRGGGSAQGEGPGATRGGLRCCNWAQHKLTPVGALVPSLGRRRGGGRDQTRRSWTHSCSRTTRS